LAFQTIQGSGGAPDSFLGTAGVDVILLQNPSKASFLSAQAADDQVTVTSFQGLVSSQTLYGGQGNDTVAVQNATNFLNSFIAQNEGNDTVTLNAVTSSTIQGNQGNDTITTTGLVNSSVVNGNQGNDQLNINGGVAGANVWGGVGFDVININSNLSATSRVQGNEDDDAITIAAGVSLANSTVNGNQGNDNILIAGALGGFATSTLYGGTGNDTINAANAGIGVALASNDGNDQVTGSGAADSIVNDAGNDTIVSGAGNDTITAAAGNNQVTADAGNDRVTLAAGLDTVNGGAGTDVIDTGAGNDTIVGGTGGDNITGGAGTDSYIYNAITQTGPVAATPAGIAIATADIDVYNINSLLDNDTITLFGNTGAGGLLDSTLANTNISGAAANTAYVYLGTYNAANGTFTSNGAGGVGTDALITWNDGNGDQAAVLTGTAFNFAAFNFTANAGGNSVITI